jgi:uncharacterized protein
MFIKPRPVKNKQTKKTKQDTNANEMVQCQTCSIYVELDEAILSNAKYYCSQECLEKGA